MADVGSPGGEERAEGRKQPVVPHTRSSLQTGAEQIFSAGVGVGVRVCL